LSLQKNNIYIFKCYINNGYDRKKTLFILIFFSTIINPDSKEELIYILPIEIHSGQTYFDASVNSATTGSVTGDLWEWEKGNK